MKRAALTMGAAILLVAALWPRPRVRFVADDESRTAARAGDPRAGRFVEKPAPSRSPEGSIESSSGPGTDPADVRGRVSGMVYDVHGTPAAADVILRSKADPFDRVVRVRSGAAWGTWRVKASADGYVPSEAELETWRPRELELRLWRASQVEGRVEPVQESGAESPWWPYSMDLELVDAAHRQPGGWVCAERESDGGFVFRRVPPGRYHVMASCPGFAETRSAEFEVREGATVHGITLRLSAGATVRGAIRDERTGEPIPGAEVHMCQDREDSYYGLPCTPAEASGQYVLPGLPAGKVDLRYGAPDHADRVLRLDLAAGSEVLQDVLLARGACVRGRIRVDGAPPDGSLGLYLIPGDSSPYQRGKTDADGAYVIRGLGEGNWVIGVSLSSGDAGRQEWSRAFRADGHADVVIEFELSTRPTLSGTARVGGDPLSRAHLLFHAGGPEDAVRRVRCDEEGHFQIDGLAPGGYVVAIDDDRRSEWDPATGKWPFETDPASLRIAVPLGATDTRMDLEFPALK